MADVIRDGDGRSGGRNRAQLILVAGLVIAVTFVALALTLNTVIYTENLATRSSDIAGGDDAIRFLDVAREGITGIVTRANREHNGSHGDVVGNVTGGLDAWRNATGRSYAINGIVTNVSKVDVTNGTRMRQANRSRNFTSADGSANWTLAPDVSGTRQFWLNVSRSSLADSTHTSVDVDSDVFHVYVADTASEWRVFVYEDTSTSTVNVTVVEDGGPRSGPCSAADDHVLVNVTAGTVGGDPCSAFSFVSDLDPSYEIRYNETNVSGVGDTVTGTYHLFVDDPNVAQSPEPQFNEAPGNSPWADAAVYAIAFDANYETERLRYNASLRIAPGEPDD